MRTGIMQPYFFPYIGYFQLINSVDKFIIYDKVKYTKKGWINRNRILVDNKVSYITLPLKAMADDSYIVDRVMASEFDSAKLVRRISQAYRDAPHWRETMPLVEAVVLHPEVNLFRFLLNGIQLVCRHLDIRTPLIVSSALDLSEGLKGEDRVIALCKAIGADVYINPPGGIDLYSDATFKNHQIELLFLNPKIKAYLQGNSSFTPNLSIIDVLMRNPLSSVKTAFLEPNEHTRQVSLAKTGTGIHTPP